MKRDLRAWLPTTLLCGLLVGVAIAGNRLMSAQSSSPNAQDDVVLAKEPVESRALTERRAIRRPPRPSQAPATRSLPSLPIPLELPEVPDIASAITRLPEMATYRGTSPSEAIERRCENLSVQIQQAKAANNTERMDELKSELKKAVTDHFERLETLRKEQIAILAARLESLNKVLEARSENADQIVERRIKQLLGESDSLDWNPQIETTETWRPAEIRTRELSRMDGLSREVDLQVAEVARRESIANMRQALQSREPGFESGISSMVDVRGELFDKIRSELPTVAEESKAEIDERRAILDEKRRKLELERRERLKPKVRNLEGIQ